MRRILLSSALVLGVVSHPAIAAATDRAHHADDGASVNASHAVTTTAIKSNPIVAASSTTTGGWSVDAQGRVSSFQGSATYGDLTGRTVGSPVVSMAGTNDGHGYWLATADGHVYPFGDARSFGSLPANRQTSPVVSIAATSDNGGYWLAAANGHVSTFGNAHPYGSLPSNGQQKVVSMAATPGSGGYWLASANGQVSAFGNARGYGSIQLRPNNQLVSIAATADGGGYYLAAAKGRVSAFGDALRGRNVKRPIATLATGRSTTYVVGTGGSWSLLAAVPSAPSPNPVATAPVHVSTLSAIGMRVSGNQLVNAAGRPVRLLGADAIGTENACVVGKRFSWGPLDSSEANQIAAWHLNSVRVPLNEDCWLGINGLPREYSAAAYRAAIADWVHVLNHAGLEAALDLHWSAPGAMRASGQAPMPDSDHSVAFWSSVAGYFSSNPSVAFDLFNEPALGGKRPTVADWQCWRDGCQVQCTTAQAWCTDGSYHAAGMQDLVSAVRKTGAAQPLLVAGLSWAGDPCGLLDAGPVQRTCAWLAYKPTDPKKQIALSFHTYDWTACATVTCWNASLLPIAGVAPVVTTEFGERGCSATFDTNFMKWADKADISYVAQAWKAGNLKTTCSAANRSLLAGWDSATPNHQAPAAAAIHNHLGALHLVAMGEWA